MILKISFVAFFVTIPIYCVGSPNPPAGEPSWIEHWDLVRVMMAGMFGLVAFFLIRTLNSFDRNQTALFNRMREAETSLAELKGRCDALSCGEE